MRKESDKFDFSEKVHFAVHRTPVQEKTLKISAHLHQIVLKRPNGTIMNDGFTGLEQYAYPYRGIAPDQSASIAPARYKLLYICKCLNYLFYYKGIRSLYDVTPSMLHSCFDEYRTTELIPGSGVYVKQDTLDKFVKVNCAFFANMALMNAMRFDPIDLMKVVVVYGRRNSHGKGRGGYEPRYHKKAIASERKEVMREIPEAAVPMLMEEIQKHDPMICFAVILQAYAGLRASECMNLRREDSPLSITPGIEIRYIGTYVSEIYVDLTHEYHMRSDGVDVGKIKRDTDRLTLIYPKNNRIVFDAYKKHLMLLSEMPYEKDYAPLFVSAGGKAMTTETYQKRFNRVVKEYLCPRLLKEADPQLTAFGQALLIHHFPSHGLRHYFSVHLALDGLDAAQIKSYCGDRSVDSAVVYLQKKGILEEQLRKAHSIALDGLTKKGGYVP